MASDWNRFTSKIFKEGRAKHGKSYSFKQALKEASDRKGEMGKMGSSPVVKTGKSKRSRKSMKKSSKSKGKTRKNHKK